MAPLKTSARDSYDEAANEAFGERMIAALNDGALCLMTSIGHRTGLFDTMEALPPATTADIAHEAGLQERYVREWLDAMTVSRVVKHDATTGRYWLPDEHAAFLTRGSGENVAVFAQYVGLLGSVEDDVVACFREGGGVPYERYPRFHEVMAEDSGQTVLTSLVTHILPLVPGLAERLDEGIDVLDIGCGRGRALIHLAGLFPKSRFMGYDLSREAIAEARAEADAAGLDNVVFEARDLTSFSDDADPEVHDLVTTFDAVHDQKSPQSVLRGIRRTLKPDGVYLMQDIHGSSHVHNNLDHPVGPLLYTISCMHCMAVSLAQEGEGLGAMWGREKAVALLEEAGFDSIDIHRLEHDFQNDYYVVRP